MGKAIIFASDNHATNNEKNEHMRMKDLVLITIATLGLMSASIAQNLPNYVSADGLVGWWPFNGNCNDESGNNLFTASEGAIYSSDRFGNGEKSLYFLSDTNSFITGSIPYVPSLTFSFWLKQNSPVTDFPVPFYFHDGSYNDYFFYCNSRNVASDLNNRMFIRMGSDFGTPPGVWFDGSVPYSSSDSSWNHIAITIDNTSKIVSIYKNSILSATYTFNGQIKNFNKVNFGHANKGNFQERFVGALDDIAIWNRSLTQQEITDLYNGNSGITGFNSVTHNNIIKIFPNPANDYITIDYGNFAIMNGYQLKIQNSIGQQIFQTNITQQTDYLSLNNWGGNGLYFVHLIDAQGNTIDIRKIVLQ